MILNRIALLEEETEKICKRTAIAKQKTNGLYVNKAYVEERLKAVENTERILNK